MVPKSGNEDKPGLLEYLEVIILLEILIAFLGYHWLELVCTIDSGVG
jgi:hypothetical protein